MFHLLRRYFAGREAPAWRGWRGWRLAGLFVFEFTVVLLGVLAAQWLAAEADERRERRLAAETHASMNEELQQLVTTLTRDLRAARCVYQELAATMRSIDAPTEEPRWSMPLPLMITPRISEWGDERRVLMERYYGPQVVTWHENLVTVTGFIAENQREMERNFATIRLLRDDFGPVSPTDRTAIRLSISQAMQNNGFLGANAGQLTVFLRAQGFQPDEAALAAGAASGLLCADQLTTPHPAEAEAG
jgi:hypothetical protein